MPPTDMPSTSRPERRERAVRVLPRMTETHDRAETHDTTEARLRWLEELREQSLHAGSERAVARQRERGKLLARERLEKLLDPGWFVEVGRFVRHLEAAFG